MISRPLRLSLVALALVTLVTACGRRGPLDAPPGADDQKQSATPGNTQDGSRGIKSKRTPIVPPKRDLFIDGLLD